jgi:uncharacterized protein YjbJ (UPF0337 family)
MAGEMLNLFNLKIPRKEIAKMNPEILKGRWNQLKGDIRRRWGKLTDDDMVQVQGQVEKMIGKLQERYGYKREQAERELNDFLTASTEPTRRTA